MTAVSEDRMAGRSLRARLPTPAWPAGLPRVRRVASAPPPDWRTSIASYALTMISVVLLVLIVNLVVISQLQHFTSQNRLYSKLRLTMAEGSVPIGQLDVHGDLVAPGTPVALLDIPRLGVDEVVVEGTSSQETKLGVGHRRDTPFPGQAGVSVLMGRAAAYGGVFKHLSQLRSGDELTVTTGQGISTYRVIGARIGDVELPALDAQHGRITLVTASGAPFQPHGALRVDAELTSEAFPRPPVAITYDALPPEEEVLAGDRGRAFSLSWLAELLVIAAVASVWSWKRWNHLATWVVFVPVLGLLSLACADRIADLLPNLL